MIRSLALAMILTIAPLAPAEPPSLAPERPDRLVEGPLEPLNYFVGDWAIDARWAWGDTLEGRNEYRVGLGGRFLEVVTLVRDNGGPLYERYHSFYTYDAANDRHVAWGLAADGSVSSMPHTLEVVDGLPHMEFITDNPDGSRLRQTLTAIDENTCAWKVWMTAAGNEGEQLIMDDQWERVTLADPWASADSAPMTGPYDIDANKFVADGADLRTLTKTIEVNAPASEVFDAWASGEGWRRVYASPGAEANIDLAIGGRYEWLFNGALGSNGCQILSYIPDRMLSFTWNAPPQFPETRARRTWVVVELDEIAKDQTEITLTHLGFGEGEAWDKTLDYFNDAWGRVLEAMRAHFER